MWVVAISQATIDCYQTNAKSLMAYATTLVGPARAEDLVADTMVGIFSRVDLGAVENPRGYLFRSVLNQARSNGRRDAARRRRERAVGSRSMGGGPVDAGPDGHGRAPRVADELGLLAGLSTRERAVIYLTYWEDMAVADVAHCLGVSDGSVRRYLARARTKIRKELTS